MANITINDLHSTDAELCLSQEMADVDAASVYGGFVLHIGEKVSVRIGGDKTHIDINHPHPY